jgi:hypothetical protein
MLLLTHPPVYNSVRPKTNPLLNVYARIMMPEIAAIQRFLKTECNRIQLNYENLPLPSLNRKKITRNPKVASVHHPLRKPGTTKKVPENEYPEHALPIGSAMDKVLQLIEAFLKTRSFMRGLGKLCNLAIEKSQNHSFIELFMKYSII